MNKTHLTTRLVVFWKNILTEKITKILIARPNLIFFKELLKIFKGEDFS